MKLAQRTRRCNFCRMGRRIAAILLAAACVASLGARPARAAGTEETSTGNDLTIHYDSRWAGGNFGGYHPVRVRLVNHGPPRVLTFRFSSIASNMPMPTVKRTVLAEQNATVRFTLPIPMVSNTTWGTLNVLDGGKVLTAHSRQLTLPDSAGTFGRVASDSVSLLLISPTPAIDTSRLNSAMLARSTTSTSGPRFYGSASQLYSEVVPPTSLPDSWIDYSGLDLVALSLPTLSGLSSSARDALVGWVECGGTLIVHGVAPGEGGRGELERLLKFSQHRFVDAEWTPADPSQRKEVVVPQLDPFGNPIATPVPAGPDGQPLNAVPEEKNPWTLSPDTFASRRLMLGRVCAFAADPFPGTPSDWNWFLRSLEPFRLNWSMRHGMSSRTDHNEFLLFLNPGVSGVPRYTFLVLITIFAVVIGPVNYVLLWKRRQLYLLILTVPAIAFVTSGSLLAYSVVAHGFSVKSRVRSLTILDQPAQTAITTARLALYAGMAPSDGLRFSSETAVFPIWPAGAEFESATVDWTDTQHLESGWLHSRTHTQFLTMSRAAARGRLEVNAPQGDELRVSNGLEWDIEALLVADESGQLYAGTNIAAGAAATLHKPTDSELSDIRALLTRNAPELPEGLSSTSEVSIFEAFSPRASLARIAVARGDYVPHFDDSRMEATINSLTKVLPASSYMAVIGRNPGVETGVPNTREEAGFHLILGYY